MRSNHVLQAWRAGKQTVGGWLSIDSTYTAETMAQAGFDWLCLDMQHGLLDYNDVKKMLPAISTTDTMPFVRVPWNEPYEIMKVLDAGAHGVITRHHRSSWSYRVDSCPDLERGNRDFPTHEHGDDDGGPEPAFIGRPDQDLVAELLLN